MSKSGKLNDDNIKLSLIRSYAITKNYAKTAREHEVDPKTVRAFLKKEAYKEWWETHSPNASGSKHNHHNDMTKLGDKKRYVFTSAQNNTYVNKDFLKALELYCGVNDAELIVGTFSYNLSGFQNLQKGDGEWFDPLIEKYIIDEPKEVFDNLLWLGELNILPTAVNPLSGLHNYTKLDSAIIPHCKVAMESLPTHKQHDPKFLYTTGAVTLQNYIQKASGQKASFHHVFGAVVAESDGENWFVRQLICDSDGGFYDLDTYYHNDSGASKESILALNYGDIHSEKEDKEVYDVCFRSEGNMLDTLKPQVQFCHDILDFEARNHHTINDPHFRFKKFVDGEDTVEDNIKSVAAVLKQMSRPYCRTVVVESNHDLALKRWLKNTDYRTDPTNAILFLDLQCRYYKSIKNNIPFQPLKEALLSVGYDCDNSNVLMLSEDSSFKVYDKYGEFIECGLHGHLGINGSRGSANSYTKLGSRYNIGHSHSACIKDGVYQAGVIGKLDMGYNKTPGSWSHSNIITYKNGKRAIVTIKKDGNGKAKWKA